MEKNGNSRRFVVVIMGMVMMIIINILSSVSEVEGFTPKECNDMCKNACSGSPVYDFCMKDCMDQCQKLLPPPAAVSQAVHHCNLGCVDSLCSNFVSGS